MYLNLTFYQSNLFDSNEKYNVQEADKTFSNLKFGKCLAGLMGNVFTWEACK